MRSPMRSRLPFALALLALLTFDACHSRDEGGPPQPLVLPPDGWITINATYIDSGYAHLTGHAPKNSHACNTVCDTKSDVDQSCSSGIQVTITNETTSDTAAAYTQSTACSEDSVWSGQVPVINGTNVFKVCESGVGSACASTWINAVVVAPQPGPGPHFASLNVAAASRRRAVRMAAEAVSMLHAAVVAFVAFGFLAFGAGAYFRWRWVRQPALRLLHVSTIGAIAAISWFRLDCPLSVLEMRLAAPLNEPSWVLQWMRAWVYGPFHPAFTTPSYLALLLAAVALWVVVPPRPLRWRARR